VYVVLVVIASSDLPKSKDLHPTAYTPAVHTPVVGYTEAYMVADHTEAGYTQHSSSNDSRSEVRKAVCL